MYCPNRHCRGDGKPFAQGYLVKNGTSRGQPRAWGKACEARVVLRYGTAYYGLEADSDQLPAYRHTLLDHRVGPLWPRRMTAAHLPIFPLLAR